MTGLVDAVRGRVSPECLVSECDKDNCSVCLQDAPEPRLIVDFDRPDSPLKPKQKRCDYLLVAEPPGKTGWVVPMEFKSGSSTNRIRRVITEVVEQLQAGACVADKLVPKDKPVDFLPVAVFSARKYRRIKLRDLRRKVRFRDENKTARWLTCGQSLTEALGS